jgi:hypothetical protein
LKTSVIDKKGSTKNLGYFEELWLNDIFEKEPDSDFWSFRAGDISFH